MYELHEQASERESRSVDDDNHLEYLTHSRLAAAAVAAPIHPIQIIPLQLGSSYLLFLA